MITADTKVWWHGCWLEPGHHLFLPTGRPAPRDDRPYSFTWLDAGVAPRISHRDRKIVFGIQDGGDHDKRREVTYRSDECPQGQFLRHYWTGCNLTVISWWDRTQGDTRGNCNSCFLAEGDHTTAEMLETFPRHFPKQAKRLADAGVELVEVFAS